MTLLYMYMNQNKEQHKKKTLDSVQNILNLYM